MVPPTYAIQTCAPAHREAALRLLHAELPTGKQDELVLTLSQAPLASDEYWRGLIIAGSPTTPTGAAWLQPAVGNFAVYWPPSATNPAAVALYRAVGEVADAHGWPLVQLLASDDQTIDAQLLAAGDFTRLAQLAYMAVEPAEQPAPKRVEFHPHAGSDGARLAQLLEQTFVDTQDCPQLEGLRDLDDTLSGYRAQGAHDPAQWYVVRRSAEDAGVLLLTRHPATGNWELIYMGVIPKFRGMGLGQEIVRYAIDAASRGDAQQLILAVDAENKPALRIYRAAGFRIWDQQVVYGRLARP